jgi:hypothetical protein
MPTLEQLQEALDATEGRTPKEVLDAFLPKGKKIGGLPLVDLTLGHALFLAQLDHPLSKGRLNGWEPHETGLALYAFTRCSKELKTQIHDGSLEDKLYEFINSLSFGEIPKYTAILMAHYLNSIQTGMEMHDPNSKKSQKKTVLGGLWEALRGFVANIIGRLNLSSMNYR